MNGDVTAANASFGDIPNDWPIRRIGDIADVKTGPFGSALHESDYVRSGTPIITVEHLGERGLETSKDVPRVSNSDRHRLRAYQLLPGDIVFSRVGSIDRSALVQPVQSGWLFSGRLLRVRFKDPSANPQFFSYQLQTHRFKQAVRAVAVGQTMPSLNTRILNDLTVFVPPADEQNAIARQLSDMDELITSLSRLIAKKRDIRRGTMQALLTGRTRLPGFDADWQDLHLGDHVDFLKTANNSRAELSSRGPVKYLHYGDIHTSNHFRLDARVKAMPRLDALRASSAGRLRVGDVVFVDASEDETGVGKSVEITGTPDGGVIAGLHTIAARFDKTILADGFKSYLQFCPQFRTALLRLAAGTKVLSTTRNHVASVVMNLPGVDEQVAIAKVLRDMDEEVDALELRMAKSNDIKQGMVQHLLPSVTRIVAQETAS